MIVPAESAPRELEQFGLTTDLLLDAIAEGEAGRDSCTPHDPPSLPGIYAWGRTVRALRDRLVPLGWAVNDNANYSTVISPDGSMAIAVATGDRATGTEDMTPTTKYPKGEATQAAVVRNQLSLFSSQVRPAHKGPLTWILLISRQNDVVAAELSAPESMTDSGYVVTWKTRILLALMDLEGGPTKKKFDDGDDDFQIDVVKK